MSLLICSTIVIYVSRLLHGGIGGHGSQNIPSYSLNSSARRTYQRLDTEFELTEKTERATKRLREAAVDVDQVGNNRKAIPPTWSIGQRPSISYYHHVHLRAMVSVGDSGEQSSGSNATGQYGLGSLKSSHRLLLGNSSSLVALCC